MSWNFGNGVYAWKSNNATAASGPISCQVSPSNPLGGVGQWTELAKPLPLQLFQIEGFATGNTDDGDWMNRQDDLSVSLPYTADRPTGVECYWCGTDDSAGGFQLEAWISASTRLLDAQVQCHSQSTLEVTQVQLLHIDAKGCIENSRELDAGDYHFSYRDAGNSQTGDNQVDQERAFLCAVKGSDYQLLLAGYPGDQSEIKLSLADGRLSIEQHLRFGFMEKGVIRRTRLFASLLPAVPALSVEVDRRLQQFYQSPLPLTV